MDPEPLPPTLIVDCSTVVKWVLADEDDCAQAWEMALDWASGAVQLAAPDLLPSELGSAFLRAARTGRITDDEAHANITDLLRVPVAGVTSAEMVHRAYEIARAHSQRIYDCFYVALAEHHHAEFWTGDERLYNALGRHFTFVHFIRDYVARR